MMQSEIRDGRICVSGCVSIQTLNDKQCRLFRNQCMQPETHSIDFSGVTRADSACISLLLIALRERQGSLKLIALPESVRALAKLYEVEEWLDI